MNKQELAQLVDHTYALWNQTVNPVKQKETYSAWYSMLHPFSYDECLHEVERLAVADTYMPRPGSIARTLHIRNGQEKNKASTPPSPEAAWAKLRELSESAYNGTTHQTNLHECVQTTIHLLGGTAALKLHTNADRNSFIEAYKQTVTNWENNLIQLSQEQQCQPA